MATRGKNAAATRESLLDAARRRFMEESYETVSLREIAGEAGVDVALVARYFGSKEELFREVFRSSRGDWLDPAVTPESLAHWLAALATQEQPTEDLENLERLLIILRSASSPKAADIVRHAFREDVLGPLTRLLPGPDAEVRASLALSILTGFTILRTIMNVEPLQASGTAAARARLEDLLAAALEKK